MAVRVGDPAPDFSLEGVVEGDFRTLGLKEFRGKWVVLYFYPLDFTFV
jgi:peroxiredoxin